MSRPVTLFKENIYHTLRFYVIKTFVIILMRVTWRDIFFSVLSKKLYSHARSRTKTKRNISKLL